MVQLGEGIAETFTKSQASALGGLFESAMAQMAEECYRRVREDMTAEVRAEVQRIGNPALIKAVADAIRSIGAPTVNVAAPNVQVDLPETEVTVNVPPAPAPITVVERPKKLRLVRDPEGKITGVDASG